MFNTITNRIQRLLKTDVYYLLQGGSWLVMGQGVAAFSGFILALAFANLIDPIDYGIYKYVISILGILTIPSLPGMVTAMTSAISKGNEGSFSLGLRNRLYWGALGTLGSVVIASYYLFQGNMLLGILFLIIAPFIPFFESSILYYAILHGKKKWREATVYSALTQILATFAILITLFKTRNIYIIVSVYIITWTVLRLYFLIRTQKKYPLNTITDNSVIPYGKHLTTMNILALIGNQLDKILLFQFIGAQELAFYALAIAMPDQIKSLFKNGQVLIIPKFATQTKETIKLSIKAKQVLFFIVLVISTICYILLAPILFNYLFPKYNSVIPLSQIYALSILGMAVVLPLSMFQSHAAVKQLYQYNTIRAITQIFFLIIGISFFKLEGVIYSRVANDFFSLGLAYFISRRY